MVAFSLRCQNGIPVLGSELREQCGVNMAVWWDWIRLSSGGSGNWIPDFLGGGRRCSGSGGSWSVVGVGEAAMRSDRGGGNSLKNLDFWQFIRWQGAGTDAGDLVVLREAGEHTCRDAIRCKRQGRVDDSARCLPF